MNATFGITWPRWYVYWRGRRWLRLGYCPNCYSSPPRPHCRICWGSFQYGNHGISPITPQLRDHWRAQWDAAMKP